MPGASRSSACITWRVTCWRRPWSRGRRISRSWRCRCRAGTRCWWRCRASGATGSSGRRSDDAAGEAFDKTAKLLGLGYPGGPALAALAEQRPRGAFEFPRPMLDRPGLDFSFSGLKTAVVVAVRGRVLDDAARADVARGFEDAIVDTLVAKSLRALRANGPRHAGRRRRRRREPAAARGARRGWRRPARACTSRARSSAPTMPR